MNKKSDLETTKVKKGRPSKTEKRDKRSDKSVFMMKAKGQSFDEFQEAVIKAFMEKGLLSESTKITGGDGASIENALIVTAVDTNDGVSAEKKYIESQCGKWYVDFTVDLQMQIDHQGRHYDLIYVKMKKDDSKREFWFDVTSFFGKL